MTYLHFFVFRL